MTQGERIIQLNIALLIVVGALLLSIAQDDMSMLVITSIGVTFSLVVVDWLRWISFHPVFVNTLAFVVSFVSFTQFAGGNTGTKLNAVASLLTYLQIVLLLQKKSPRLYWQIMMLSLLQVVVAAALNLDFGAGIVFFGYIVLVVIGTIHLKIYRGKYELAENEKRSDQKLSSLQRGELADSQPGLLTFRASLIDFHDGKKIAWQGMVLCLFSLLFSFTVFYSIPRFGSAWHGPGGSTRQQVGFTSEIRFDDDGFLHESNRTVFRASFLDDDGKPLELTIPPYFKGLVLKDYEQNLNGQWSWSSIQNKNPGRLGQGAYLLNQPSDDDNMTYVRQLVRLEPAGKFALEPDSESSLVFSVSPIFQSENTPPDLVHNVIWDILFRDANLVPLPANAPYQFEVRTPLYRNLGQVPAVPVSLMFKAINSSLLFLRRDLERNLGVVCDRFDRDWKEITALAQSLVDKAGDGQSRRMICNRFVNHLKKPDFQYTRDLASIQRTPDADPIVDFLLNHKSGHCEYFATALALMLRSQGIPCRIVTGYYGGDYNAFGGFYVVKEKHAHVWVEAYLRPEDCDEEMMTTGQASELGAWLRLDPTPGSQSSTQVLSTSIIDRAFEAVGFAQKIWEDYVTGLEQDSRVLNGFDPTSTNPEYSWGAFSLIKNSIDRLFTRAREIPWWQWSLMTFMLIGGIFLWAYRRARKKLVEDNASLSTRSVFREMVTASLDSVKRIRNRLVGIGRAEGTSVDFYQEFLRLTESVGFARSTSETPQEFGDKIGSELAHQHPSEADRIRNLIQAITHAFYTCRFGENHDIENHDIEKLRQASVQQIDDLRAIVWQKKGPGS